MSDDVEAFLTWFELRLDDDEAACIREIDGTVHEGPCINYEGQDPASYDEDDSCILHIHRYRPYTDPHRGWLEVKAKRQILAEHWPADDHGPGREYCGTCREGGPDPLNYPCRTVRLIALPYRNVPGYRREWRPEALRTRRPRT